MQRDQARSDKRRTILIVAGSIIVGLGIIAVPAVKLIQDSKTKDTSISELGAAASAASCDAVIDDKASGTQDHKPDGTVIQYPVSPPSSGPHYQVWAQFGKTFYGEGDRPPVPNLVHNLEHGYTILWYNEATMKNQEQVDLIEKIAKAKLPGRGQRQVHRRPVQGVRRPAALAGRQEHRLLALERQRPGPDDRLRATASSAVPSAARPCSSSSRSTRRPTPRSPTAADRPHAQQKARTARSGPSGCSEVLLRRTCRRGRTGPPRPGP